MKRPYLAAAIAVAFTAATVDVLDQTATAKVTAMWGIDYMLLGKYDGQWKIVQILWQSHPPK